MDTPTKICWRCKQAKPLPEFHVNRSSKDGRQGKCRECSRDINRLHADKASVKEFLYDGSRVKTCSKCKRDYPSTPEYFFYDMNGNDGLGWRCKLCLRGYQYDRHGRPNKPKYQPPKAHEGYKYCPRCEQQFPATLEYFSKHKRSKGGIGSFCRDCKLKYTREHRAKNIERYKESSRRYSKTAHGKVTQQVNVRRRKTRTRGTRGHFTKIDIEHKYKAQKAKCYYCRVSIEGSYHIDHIVPISRNGTNWPDNLVLTCPHCNHSKSNKLLHEWPEGGRLL